MFVAIVLSHQEKGDDLASRSAVLEERIPPQGIVERRPPNGIVEKQAPRNRISHGELADRVKRQVPRKNRRNGKSKKNGF